MDDEIDWISEGEADQADQAVKTEEEKCVEKYAEERSFTKAVIVIAAIVIIAAIGGGVYMMLHPSTQEKTELTAVPPTPTPTIHISIPGIEGVNLLIRGEEVAFERSGKRTDFYKMDSNTIVAFTKTKIRQCSIGIKENQ